jgi:ATPase subunit of ABC transporter with duplicated ATPase domains
VVVSHDESFLHGLATRRLPLDQCHPAATG